MSAAGVPDAGYPRRKPIPSADAALPWEAIERGKLPGCTIGLVLCDTSARGG